MAVMTRGKRRVRRGMVMGRNGIKIGVRARIHQLNDRMRSIRNRNALPAKLAPIVFVRPGKLRQAQWSEFDLDVAVWRIPATRMKMKAVHLVPVSEQAVAILRELHAMTGQGDLLFPGLRSASRPMSENTVNAALHRLG